jgi:hypothetical protein
MRSSAASTTIAKPYLPTPFTLMGKDTPRLATEETGKVWLEVPKPAPRLPYLVQIGNSRGTGQEIRLFERVWSEPLEKIAAEWGLSDRGLAKACHHLKIPVPPRGFWAKAQRRQSRQPPSAGSLAR